MLSKVVAPLPAPRAQEQDPLWSETDAAAYLGIKPTTLKAWRYRGRPQLEFISVGRLRKYRKSVLDRWLSQRTRISTKQPLRADARAVFTSRSSQRAKTHPAVKQ